MQTSTGTEDKPRDACGVFACVAADSWPTSLHVGHIIRTGLMCLQHRGQESAGIVVSPGDESHCVRLHRGMGLVNNVFNEDIVKKLTGNLGVGHTRYSTMGASEVESAQPFVVHTNYGLLAIAHNGSLVNGVQLRKKILKDGIGLRTGSDSEVLMQILSQPAPSEEPNQPDWVARIECLMSMTPTSYSLVIMQENRVFAVRDPYGNRPLCIGMIPVAGYKNCEDRRAEAWIVSSESCALLPIGADLYRDVEPGEIVEITKEGPHSIKRIPRPTNGSPYPAFCIFEYVYFAQPDSLFEGQQVYKVREECGRQLAREAPVEADIVSTVPESARAAAHGFSLESNITYTEVLCKNNYQGRTFIQPTSQLRKRSVAMKFRPLSVNFTGKRIILIDDSIVRGTTMASIVKMLKDAGATEVHLRIASPPLKFPCYMGIDIPTKDELIANQMGTDDMAIKLGADSVQYLSVEGLTTACRRGADPHREERGHYCTACLTGLYPINLEW